MLDDELVKTLCPSVAHGSLQGSVVTLWYGISLFGFMSEGNVGNAWKRCEWSKLVSLGLGNAMCSSASTIFSKLSFDKRKIPKISPTAIFPQQRHLHARASWVRRPWGRPFPPRIGCYPNKGDGKVNRLLLKSLCWSCIKPVLCPHLAHIPCKKQSMSSRFSPLSFRPYVCQI